MKTGKKIFKWLGVIILVLGITGTVLYLQYVRPAMKKMEPTAVINYDENLTIVTGGGGNSGILTTDSAVLVIDTKMGDAAKWFAGMVKQIVGNRRIIIVNTHLHPDHTGGNKYFPNAQIWAGSNYTPETWKKEAGEPLPTHWIKGNESLVFGSDTLTLISLPMNAHTESDVLVYLNNRKMLFAGDVILNKQIPAMVSDAVSPQGYLNTMAMLYRQFNIQIIVPGHGDVGGTKVMTDFRQYFTDMELAARDDSRKDGLVAKYKDWNQIPIIMSPGATIYQFRKQIKK